MCLTIIYSIFFSYSTDKTESPCANPRYTQCLKCFSYLLTAVITIHQLPSPSIVTVSFRKWIVFDRRPLSINHQSINHQLMDIFSSNSSALHSRSSKIKSVSVDAWKRVREQSSMWIAIVDVYRELTNVCGWTEIEIDTAVKSWNRFKDMTAETGIILERIK